MKKILLSSVVLFVFATSIIVFQMSCSKQAMAQQTKTDTVYIYKCDTLTKEQMLTQKMWQVDYLIHEIGCVVSSYVKGGANSTGINYDIMTFKFNANGTGYTVQADGTTYQFTWNFTSTEKRDLHLVLTTASGNVPFDWHLVEVQGKYLHGTAAPLYAGGTSNNMESFRLIQIP